MTKEKTKFTEGEKVTYCPEYGEKEYGVVKKVRDDVVFVVYKRNGEWHNYMNYTACATDFKDLKQGWI
jgi:poly-D-alanine transfer protein DltD